MYVRNVTKHSIFIVLFAYISLFVYPSPIHAATGNLNIITSVINDNGGNWNPSDFSTGVQTSKFVNVAGSPFAGERPPGKGFTLNAGQYIVFVSPYGIYTSSFGGDCDSAGNVTLSSGDDKTCLITMNDKPSTLRLIVTVQNDNGGTASSADFVTHIKIGGADTADSPARGTDYPGTPFILRNGTFTVSVENKPNYSQSFSGDCDNNGNVTLPTLGEKTCIISNNDIDGATVPGLPNTGGSIDPGKNICLNTNQLPWVVLGIGLAYLFFSVYQMAVPKK